MATTDTTDQETQVQNLLQQYGVPSTGSPSLDAILAQNVGTIQQKIKAGQTINPDLDITPALVGQFTQEAHTQADPYYQQQLSDEIDNINANLQNAQTQYENNVANSNTAFQQNLLATRNQDASEGNAFSGQRGLTEQQDLDVQNRNLANLASTAQTSIGGTLRQGGADIGQGINGLNGNQSNFQTPNIQTQTTNLNGAYGGATAGNNLNYNYDPSIYSAGNLSSAYGKDLTDTQAQYQSNFLQNAGNEGTNNYQSVSSLNTPTANTTKIPTLS